MTFLQPLLLTGLPLIALPILIHLINRQRHRTIPWAAMMFLLDAKRLTRGMARLRYWLIMALRMLAIGALFFAAARPLASGLLGVTLGGRPDTTLVLLDRSASMEQQDLPSGQSKRSTALRKLSELLQKLGAGTQMVLIESVENRPQLMDTVEQLADVPETAATATTADVPAMLQAALDHVNNNQTGRTDIWIASDLRESDWKPADGRWQSIVAGFQPMDAIRFYLLSYPEVSADNLKVRMHNVRRRQRGQSAELVLDVDVRRDRSSPAPLDVPLEFVIGGARSVMKIRLTDQEYAVQGHTLPLDAANATGWGYVELPSDANLQDNAYYFVFAEPPVHHTTIVSDNLGFVQPLRLAATSPVDAALQSTATVLSSEQADQIDFRATSLLVWQVPLPERTLAERLHQFTGLGRPILFFPPDPVGDRPIFGARWGAWHQNASPQTRVDFWRGDSDLWRQTRSGEPLPIGSLEIRNYCSIDGPGSVLARLPGGLPLLLRASAASGPVYFCATWPQQTHSTLARDGVAFYVMIQRALAQGVATQGLARQLAAGSAATRKLSEWTRLSAPTAGRLAAEPAWDAGAYRREQRLMAVNRPEAEDRSQTVDSETIDRLFGGLDYRQVEDHVRSETGLASEIWQAFLVVMALALVAEAWLCLPKAVGR